LAARLNLSTRSMNQIRKKEVIPDDTISVIWVAEGAHVFQTSLSEFEQKVEEAKKKENLRTGYLGFMHGKRYAR